MCKLSVFKNGKIVTMEKKLSEADSIAIENGRIVALGSFSELYSFVDKGADVYDLRGMAVLPGFTDCHAHLVMTGIRSQQLELGEATSFSDIIDKLESWDKENPEDGWLVGWGIDDNILREGRMPGASDLDKAGVKRAIWVQRTDGNSSAVNSEGLQQIDINLNEPSVLKDNKGRPTGIFKTPASFSLRLQVLNSLGKEYKQKAVEWSAGFAITKGITSLHPMEYLVDVPILDEIAESLPVRLKVYVRSDEIETIIRRGYKTIAGDVLLDGTFGCHTAAISGFYADNPKENGVLYYQNREDFLVELFKRAREEHIQSAFHSIGDRAIEMHIRLLEKVFGERPAEPIQHRIEHFVLPNDDQIRRAAKLGIMASVAPISIRNCSHGGVYSRRLGVDLVKKTLPLKKMIEAGIIVGGNSDTPVYDMNPFYGISEAVNSLNEAQKISIMEAIMMYTLNGARLGLREDDLGSLAVGKMGDMVVLKQNPFEISSRALKNVEVAMTVVGGEIKFKTEDIIWN